MGQRMKRGRRGSIIHDIPEEIINEILLNLPVKSLLRFKCVSKPWRASISSKRFTEEHLKKSTSNRKLIYKFSGKTSHPNNLWSCSVKSFLDCDNFFPTATEDHVPIGNWCRFAEILGSCNGLVLIGVDNTRCPLRIYPSSRDLLVWNPSTRQLRHIPPPSYPKPRIRRPEHRYIYGFGYDDSTDDYKIAFVFSFKNTHRTEIYSLRNDSWKRIGDFEPYTPFHSSGKLVKGKLYWVGFDKRQYTSTCTWTALGPPLWDVVALDLAKEEYEIVVRPQHLSYYDLWHREVLDLGGYLGLVCIDRMTSDIHLWSMTKYGEAESWTKIWAREECNGPEWNRISPLLLSENGDIAVCTGSCIDVYNINDDKCRKSKLYKLAANLGVHGFYVESLVSPFENCMRREQQPKQLFNVEGLDWPFGKENLADEFDHPMWRKLLPKQPLYVGDLVSPSSFENLADEIYRRERQLRQI